jgi:hypothetical protein
MEAEPSIASSEEISELYSSLDWGSLWPRMVSYTLATMRRRYRLKGSKEDLHDTTQDLVEECYRRVFVLQSRKWNKTHYPDPEDFLFDVLSSLVNKWVNGKKQAPELDDNARLDEIPDDGGMETDAHLNKDELLSEYTTQLAAMGADDDEMLIFNARVHYGLTKPEEIRRDLGMTDRDYHNAFRKLHRKLLTIRAKLDS